jgi:hypothetical protein
MTMNPGSWAVANQNGYICSVTGRSNIKMKSVIQQKLHIIHGMYT